MKTMETDILKKAEINQWFQELIIVTGDHGQCTFDEMASWIWACFVTKLERDRSVNKIHFIGTPRQICDLAEMRDIISEYEIHHIANTKELSLDSLSGWVAKHLCALLKVKEVRGLKNE